MMELIGFSKNSQRIYLMGCVINSMKLKDDEKYSPSDHERKLPQKKGHNHGKRILWRQDPRRWPD